MGSISDFLEDELLDHVCNAAYSPPGTVYLGLSTADPLDTGAGLAEPSGNGYIRKAITFAAAASRAILQNADVNFNQATGSWGTITHYAVFDQESGGNMMGHGALGTSKEIVSGNTPSVASGEVSISFNAGYITNYLAHKLLDFAFRNQAYSAPDTYAALSTGTISDDGSGFAEPSDGYARKQVNPNGGAAPDWTVASGGALTNDDNVDIGPASGAWGTIVAMAVCDAVSGGNVMMYDNGVTDQSVGSGDTVRFPAGDLDISLS